MKKLFGAALAVVSASAVVLAIYPSDAYGMG